MVAVADAIYGDMQYARSEAIRNNQNVQISFSGGASWCYGMILGTTACDCSVVASSSTGYCALRRVDYLDFQKVSIPAPAGISFSGNKTGFDPVRGVALGTGHVIMESALGKQAQQLIGQLSRVASAEVVADAAISPGGCRVETRHGVIDQRIETQLARIEAELT